MGKGKNVVRMPDGIQLMYGREMVPDGEGVYSLGDVTVRLIMCDDVLEAYLQAAESAVSEVVLHWNGLTAQSGALLGDHWERGYGDLAWKKKEDTSVMPWYFLDDRGNECLGFGVKVRPGAMCWWECQSEDLLLHLDVRCGGEGVLLSGRELKMAGIVMRSYEETDAFEAAQSFCRAMCDDPIMPGAPIYGSNNWYYAYGNSSREDILRDAQYLAGLTKGNENRPFMVIDDGWQTAHTGDYNGGPWDKGNADYGDMKQLAADIKSLNVRPGIWFRPLLDERDTVPSHWRLKRNPAVLDISVPEVLDHVRQDVARIREWGFELIKHDFSTYDLFGFWGFEMGYALTTPGGRFSDASRTTAEIIVDFYRAIREAAGDALVLGCNCIGHLGAGLMEANRTGDDTSGVDWGRTRKMGVNTLAFRLPQHGSFFGADADCCGITDKIPWEKNRQWMELLSLSGTPFFVSVKPGTLSSEQENELKAAYRRASANTVTAVPLDWKENPLPGRWSTFEGIKEYNWFDSNK